MQFLVRPLALSILLLLFSLPLAADSQTDIYALDIEQLMDIEIQSVSKKSQSLWVPSSRLELSVVGQNITNKDHAEFTTPFNVVQNTAIPRSVHGRVIVRF